MVATIRRIEITSKGNTHEVNIEDARSEGVPSIAFSDSGNIKSQLSPFYKPTYTIIETKRIKVPDIRKV